MRAEGRIGASPSAVPDAMATAFAGGRFPLVSASRQHPADDRQHRVIGPPSSGVGGHGVSGLDPQISPAYAELQTPRVARERGMSEEAVRKLVAQCTSGRGLGILGEPAGNVVELNAALDRTRPVSAKGA